MKAILRTPIRFGVAVTLAMISLICLGSAIAVGNSSGVSRRYVTATAERPAVLERVRPLEPNDNTGLINTPSATPSLIWTNSIPAPIANGSNPQSGRIFAMAVDPADANVIYVGGFGGLMKGTYNGQAWTWTFLSNTWKSQSVTSVAIDPRSSPNSRIIYAGTGHIDAPRVTRIALTPNGQWFNRWFGAGLYRSTDSGMTWVNLRGPNDAFVDTVITGLAVDPSDSTVYVGQDRLKNSPGGLWKSNDAGETWSLEFPEQPCPTPSGNQWGYGCEGVFAVGLDPSTTPSTVYIAEKNGVQQKRPNQTWRRIYPANSCWVWPEMWKIKLIVSGGVPRFLNPNPSPAGGACQNETVKLLSSENAQDATPVWNVISTLCSHAGYPCPDQNWQTTEINPEFLAVDPSDRRSIFIGSIHTWHANLPTPGPNPTPTPNWVDLQPNQFHVDLRSMAFSATTPRYVFVGNDGGIWRSQTQTVNQPWENLNQDLPGMILKSAAIAHNATGGITLVGGTTDNGSLVYDQQGVDSKWMSFVHEPEADADADSGANIDDPNGLWGILLGGDAENTLIDPNNPDVFYYTNNTAAPYRRTIRGNSYSDDIGPPGHYCQKWTLTTNATSPSPPHIVVPCEVGSTRLISRTWDPTAFDPHNIFWQDMNSPAKMSIAREAPSDAKIIYAVEDGALPLELLCDAKIYVTTNAPSPSTTPGATPTWSPGEYLYNKHVRALTIHPTNPQIAYLACYEGIWKTTDMGHSWFPLTFDDKVNLDYSDVAIDPVHPDVIFTAGSAGVFMSVTGGVQNDWTFMSGIPKGMIINSLSFDPITRKLIGAAIGRGVYVLDLSGFTPPAVTPTPNPTRTPSPSPSASPTPGPSPTPSPIPVSVTVSLPIATVDTSTTNFVQPVTVSNINAADNLTVFQGDITFDETVITFQNPPISAAGLTGANWSVFANILPGSGPIRTLTIAAFSGDGFTPLSGAGVLGNLNMKRVSNTAGANTALTWSSAHPFEFIDVDGDTHTVSSAPPGRITVVSPISISGLTGNCSSPAATATPPASPTPPTLPPVSDVTMTLTGSATGSTLTNGSGNYSFGNLNPSGTYTITPNKLPLTPGSGGINTTDVLAVQRHFLAITVIPFGCRLSAADANVSGTITTTDVIAIQRFFLAYTSGIASCGQYNFAPLTRTYTSPGTNTTGADFATLIIGDVASPFANRDADIASKGTSGQVRAALLHKISATLKNVVKERSTPPISMSLISAISPPESGQRPR